MSFPYKHVLLIGATAGIGKAMADHFISQGIKVTAVGRRKERLDAFSHPTIDAVFLNAGRQGHYSFSDPSSVSLKQFNHEITTNFTALVALTHAFLPHLLTHPTPTALLFTGTGVSLVPAFPLPAYSASKAALDAFIVCIHEQLRDTQVSVLHLIPGPVQTEMHDAEMGERGKHFGMPIGQFVEEAWAGLTKGEKDIFVGTVGGSTFEQVKELQDKRNGAIDRLSGSLRNFGI
ncbi:NAD(P)-binding protein [Lentithecium fluviatile CBS 122367]|uniref:NAD(P)-binding protein n=1 Tax=Lentithecium fluviatile CBS 122367 TaxID=1168545 RepID=A0A6G1IKJ7_9PLEO|nr:NAD(P)-binding protein [Lentithecium fluviatile CBS 122367]